MTPDRIADLRDRATRPRRTVPIVLNGDLRQRIEDLHAELDQLDRAAKEATDRRLSTRPAATADARIPAIDAELAELYAAAEADTLLVVVEGLAGTPWRALVAAHPAAVDDKGAIVDPANRPWGVDRAGIEEPLIRACIIGHRPTPDADVEPLDADTVDWLMGWATVDQRESLFLASWATSRGDDAVPPRRPRWTTDRSASA